MTSDEHHILTFLSNHLFCNAADLGRVVAPPGLNIRQNSALGVKMVAELCRLGYAERVYNRKLDRYNYAITKSGEQYLASGVDKVSATVTDPISAGSLR